MEFLLKLLPVNVTKFAVSCGFTKEIFNTKILTRFVQLFYQLFYPCFKRGSVDYPIYPYLKIYMCYELDLFTRSASGYKMKIR